VRDTTIAHSYAEALFELGERHTAHDAFAAAFHELTALIEQEPGVRLFLETPQIETAERKAVLERALGGRVPRLFLNFVLVVLDKRRQRLLPEIGREYDALVDEHLGRVHVDVTLAREPDERTEEEVQAELSRILGLTVIAHIAVDPRILGGLVVRWGDKVLDGSLRRRLAGMRRRMLEAEIPAR
jgi:F-type H+-transporting ATPase subunit delta